MITDAVGGFLPLSEQNGWILASWPLASRLADSHPTSVWIGGPCVSVASHCKGPLGFRRTAGV